MFNYCPLLLVKAHIQPDRDYSNTEINHLHHGSQLHIPTYMLLSKYHIKWQQMVVTLTISVNQSYGYGSSGIGTPGD